MLIVVFLFASPFLLFFYFFSGSKGSNVSIMCAAGLIAIFVCRWVNCHFSFSCDGRVQATKAAHGHLRGSHWTPKAAMVENCCFPPVCLTSYFITMTFLLLILRLIVLSFFAAHCAGWYPPHVNYLFVFLPVCKCFWLFAHGSWLLFLFHTGDIFAILEMVNMAHFIVVYVLSCIVLFSQKSPVDNSIIHFQKHSPESFWLSGNLK